MKNTGLFKCLLAGVMLLVLGGSLARAEQHRATHLGNPATRFAPTLHTVDDLRSRFRDPHLKPDIAEILKQWGWPGKMEDLCQAALTEEIKEVTIPVGRVMPFMSSRENGAPVCLRNVLWAGQEPISAYAFDFTSNGQHYRCITPKPCSNFFVEDLGPEAKPILALECEVPAKMPTIRAVKVYLTVRNTGNGMEPKATITLPVPAGATATTANAGGVIGGNSVTWAITNLAPQSNEKVCATIMAPQAGTLAFNSTATGALRETAHSDCETEMFKTHAILVEVVDLADPIEVGKTVTYIIKVTNQGDTQGTKIRLNCTLPESQEFVAGAGTTEVHAQNKTITMDPLPFLDGKVVATWQVVTKALAQDDSRFKVELTSDQFEQPIHREESTQLY